MSAADFVTADERTPERAWLLPFLRPLLPEGWKRNPNLDTDNGAGWRFTRLHGAAVGLAVMVSGTVERDNRRWVHVSLSRRDRMPSYDDMVLIKRLFIGANKRALQLFVAGDEHFNLHRFCLHLWHCVDGDGLPDFRAAGGGV